MAQKCIFLPKNAWRKFRMDMKLTQNVLCTCPMNLWKYKTVLEIQFFFINFLRSKNGQKRPKMHKIAKKCIKEAEIEKNLSALFSLELNLETALRPQKFKKINISACRVKTKFSTTFLPNYAYWQEGGQKNLLICIPNGSTSLPTHAGFFRVSKFEF